MPVNNSSDGTPSASTRRNTATASRRELSVMWTRNQSTWTAPPGRPYSAMLSAASGASASTGQTRRAMKPRGKPSATAATSTRATIVAPLTQSRVTNRGSDTITAAAMRVTGFVRSRAV